MCTVYLRCLSSVALSIVAFAAGCQNTESPRSAAAVHPAQDAGRNAEAGPAPVSTSGGQGGWCRQHAVPQSVCTRCNPELVAKFKQTGDWCAEHNLPESQCTLCHPELKEKFRAMAPKAPATSNADQAAPWQAERRPRVLPAGSDPLCQVEQVQIRLRDPGIAARAGIRTEAARLRRMTATIECPGRVEFDQRRSARVAAWLNGLVVDVPAEVGRRVAPGDLLAVLESAEIGEAKSRYIERREALKLAEADLEWAAAIENGVRRLLEESSATSQAAEGLRAGEAKGRLLKARSSLQLARANLERVGRLREQSLASEQAYEAARRDFASAEAEYQALREDLAFTVERDRLAAERSVTVAAVALRAAERQLRILGLDDEQIAAIPASDAGSLCRYELRSPVPGVVVERTAVAGEAVEAGDVLFEVADLSTMWLTIDLSQRDLPLIEPGHRVGFTVDGLPGRIFEGRITSISARVDDRTRTLHVRAELPNEGGLLRANMFGRARIVLRDAREVLSVPDDALQTDGCCQIVFVRKADDLYEPRKVAPGAQAGGYVEILDGLTEGEAVVTTGAFLMKTEILKGDIGAGCCEVDPGR